MPRCDIAPIVLLLAVMISTPIESMALAIGGPTSEWTPLVYSGVLPDPIDDHQTGQDEADIVGGDFGGTIFPAFYVQYDEGSLANDTSDDMLAFRMRLGREKNPSGFSHVALVGIDGDGDFSMDMYVIVSNSGQDEIALYTVGTGSNTSPSTTDTSKVGAPYVYPEVDGVNYDWSPVTTTNCSECGSGDLDLDGDGADYFLSFLVAFDDIAAVMALDVLAPLLPSTNIGYVIGTSTNPNAYNQDLGGVDGDPANGETWESLNASSVPMAVNPVPEPGTGFLLGLGLIAVSLARRARAG